MQRHSPLTEVGLLVSAGLGILALSMVYVLARLALSPDAADPEMRAVFGLMAAIGATAIVTGLVKTLRELRELEAQRRHEEEMRATLGLPPARKFQPPPLPGFERPAPPAPVNAAASAPPGSVKAPASAPPAWAKPTVPAPPAPLKAPAATPVIASDTAQVASAPSAPVAKASPAAAAPQVEAAQRPARAAKRTLPSGEPVLAHWKYAAEEWSAYTAGEWRFRVWEAVIVGGGLTLCIGFLASLEFDRATAWNYAIGFGLLVTLLRLGKGDSARRANASAPGEAVITPTAVMLNGVYHPLTSERIRLKRVRLAELSGKAVLEFGVEWQTHRSGPAGDEIRVPIPAGREAEALEIVAAFERGWAVEAPQSADDDAESSGAGPNSPLPPAV
jgi:hypothetical protein